MRNKEFIHIAFRGIFNIFFNIILKGFIYIILSFLLGIFINDLTESTGILNNTRFEGKTLEYSTSFQYVLNGNSLLIMLIVTLFLFYSLYLNKNNFFKKYTLKMFQNIFIAELSIYSFTKGLEYLDSSDYFTFITGSFKFNGWLLTTFLIVLIIYIIIEGTSLEVEAKKNNNNFKLFPERQKELERIKITLKNYNTIGIDGEWGEGKTFLIEELIKSEKDIEIIDVNLINVEKKDILKIIINQFDKILKKNKILSFKSRKIKGFMNNQSFFGINLNGIFSSSTPREALAEYLEIISHIEKYIYIIFDDMDRISDIEKIKRALNISVEFNTNINKNIKIIYLYSQENFKKINNGEFNRNFIEKFIPISYKLSSIKFDTILDLKIEEMQKNNTNYKIDKKDFNFIKEILGSSFHTNPEDRLDILNTFYEIKENFLSLRIKKIDILDGQIRKVENFLNEISININLNLKIEKRIIISFCFIKIFFHDIYLKFKDMNKLEDSFSVILNDKKLTLIEFSIIETIISEKTLSFRLNKTIINNTLISINELNKIFKKIDIDFESNFSKIKNSTYANLFTMEIKDGKEIIIKDRLQEVKDNFKKKIKLEENILLYSLFNYPLFLHKYKAKSRFEIYHKQDEINKNIKKLTTIGNPNWLSEAQLDYEYLKKVFKEPNIEKRVEKYYFPNKYGYENPNYIYLTDIIRENFEKDEVVSIIKVLGKDKENEFNSYLDIILFPKEINIFMIEILSNNEFLEVKEFKNKIINKLLSKNKVSKDRKITLKTVEKLIQNLLKNFLNENGISFPFFIDYYYNHSENISQTHKYYEKTLEEIKTHLKSLKIFKFDAIKKEFEISKKFVNHLFNLLQQASEISKPPGFSTSSTYTTKIITILDELKYKWPQAIDDYLDEQLTNGIIKGHEASIILKKLKKRNIQDIIDLYKVFQTITNYIQSSNSMSRMKLEKLKQVVNEDEYKQIK